MALPAFLSSGYGVAYESNKLLPPEIRTEQCEALSEAEEIWKGKFDNAMQPLDYSVQAGWDLPLYQKQYNDLLSRQTDPVDKARLLAVASPQSSDWLNAIPIPSLGLKLDNSSLRIA